MKVFLAVYVLGCSNSNHPAPTVAIKPAGTSISIIDARQPDDAIEALGVERLAVVRFIRTTLVYRRPDTASGSVGTIRKDARAAVLDEAAAGAGCKTRWIHIAPRGWACDVATEPTTEPPTRPRRYTLTDDDPAPPVTGVYGVVRGKDRVAYDSRADAKAGTGRALVGNNSVRAAGTVTIDGVRYWRTTGGDLIDASAIATFSPSQFRGVVIDGDTLPAWVRGHARPRDPVVVRAGATKQAPVTGELAARTVVAILEERDGFARVGEHAWIERRDLRATARAEPPSGTAESERWFDVDLDEQTLVAYEGTRPVYATLVSTGKLAHPTPVMIARIQSKLERTTMASDKQDVYSVADVPWTMFYDGNYALHTSYWHDGFGSVRSHGCINLSPFDARLLFRWSSPDVPPGWIAVRGDDDHPGSLVRVRSKRLAEPAFRGYAKTRRDADSIAAR